MTDPEARVMNMADGGLMVGGLLNRASIADASKREMILYAPPVRRADIPDPHTACLPYPPRPLTVAAWPLRMGTATGRRVTQGTSRPSVNTRRGKLTAAPTGRWHSRH